MQDLYHSFKEGISFGFVVAVARVLSFAWGKIDSFSDGCYEFFRLSEHLILLGKTKQIMGK